MDSMTCVNSDMSTDTSQCQHRPVLVKDHMYQLGLMDTINSDQNACWKLSQEMLLFEQVSLNDDQTALVPMCVILLKSNTLKQVMKQMEKQSTCK